MDSVGERRLVVPNGPFFHEWCRGEQKEFSRTIWNVWPSAGIAGLGLVRPEINAPNGVKSAGFSQSLLPILVRGRVLYELCKSASEDGVWFQVTESKLRMPRSTFV